jgi:hypothetical protein
MAPRGQTGGVLPPAASRGGVGGAVAPKARPTGPAAPEPDLAASLGQALLQSDIGKAFVEKAARKAAPSGAPTGPLPVLPGPVKPGLVLHLQGAAASSSGVPPQQPALLTEAALGVEHKRIKKGVEDDVESTAIDARPARWATSSRLRLCR